MVRTGNPARGSSRAPGRQKVENLSADDLGYIEMLHARRFASRASRTHERNLMLKVKLIEIHVRLHSKRERVGLSAKGAYINKALDDL